MRHEEGPPAAIERAARARAEAARHRTARAHRVRRTYASAHRSRPTLLRPHADALVTDPDPSFAFCQRKWGHALRSARARTVLIARLESPRTHDVTYQLSQIDHLILRCA